MLSVVSNGADDWASNARLAMKDGGRVLFFEPRPTVDFAGHVTQWHREQLTELGLEEPELPLLKSNPDGAVLIHPGSGGEAKCWPRERFISLGRTLKRNGLLPTFILGGGAGAVGESVDRSFEGGVSVVLAHRVV